MKITLEKIEFRYEENSINIRLFVPGEKYARWLYIDYNKWDFVCASMDGDRTWNTLKIGDFAITDGVVNRLIEFFSDAIRIYDFGNGGGRGEINTFSFPFNVLRQKIQDRAELIDEAEMNKIRLGHWPRSKVVWSDVIDKTVIYQVRDKVLPHISGLRRIAKNHSDGQLCVVHMYADSRTGQTLEQLQAGEMPSFYWEIVRYSKVADMPEEFRVASRFNSKTLRHLRQDYMPDVNIYRQGDYPIYGRIMNGGLIYHVGHGYSIHT